MASIIKVDTIQDQDGNNIISEAANTITIGASGDTITIPSGATLANSGIVTGFQSTGIDDNATSTAITIDSSENVGIGTTTPNDTANRVTLELNDTWGGRIRNSIGGTANSEWLISTSNMALFGTIVSQPLAFTTNNLERMRIDSSGNVSIGTSVGGYKLNVNGISNFSGYSNWTSGSHLYWNGGDVGITNDGTNLVFKTYDGSSLLERVRITSTGNVGIGTSSPSARLSVDSGSTALNSNFNSTNANGAYVRFQNSGTSIGDIGAGANVVSGGTAGDFAIASRSGNLDFGTGSVRRMRIDSSGNVGIGTTAPTTALRVIGQITSESNTNQNGTVINCVGTPANYHFDVRNDNSPIFRVDPSGNVLVGTTTAPNISGAIHVSNSSGHGLQITNTSASKNRRIYVASNGNLYFWNGTNEAYLTDAGAWTNASDERLKKNIRNIEYGLNTVLSTQPRHFERNDVEGTYIGFVAQELQKIVPEVVSGNPDKQLGVDYGSLVAISFKAIQEQQTQIEELKAEITALKNQP